jgi:hypothetical protein
VCRGICGKLLLPGRRVDKNCVRACVGGINFSRFSDSAKRNGGDRARHLNNWHCTAGAQRWQFGGEAPGDWDVWGLREYKSVTGPDLQREIVQRRERGEQGAYGNFNGPDGVTPSHSEARAHG